MTVTTLLPSGRAVTAAMGAALLALAILAPAANAQSFLDPDDPCPPGVEVEPVSFTDREEILQVHLLNVDCGAALDIWQGNGSGAYMPADSTRRDQMATFIVHGLRAAGYDLPAPEDQGFTDISGNVHEDNINILAEIGVTSGKTATTYDPRSPVRRDQMATFMLQAAEYAFNDQGGFEAVSPPTFDDVASGNVHADNIAAANQLLDLAKGRSETQYNPDEGTRRDQMATFVVRLVDLTLMVD